MVLSIVNAFFKVNILKLLHHNEQNYFKEAVFHSTTIMFSN